MKLVMIRAEDKRQVKKETQSGTWYKTWRTFAETKPTEEFSGSSTNYSVHNEASLHSSSS